MPYWSIYFIELHEPVFRLNRCSGCPQNSYKKSISDPIQHYFIYIPFYLLLIYITWLFIILNSKNLSLNFFNFYRLYNSGLFIQMCIMSFCPYSYWEHTFWFWLNLKDLTYQVVVLPICNIFCKYFRYWHDCKFYFW